MNGCWLIGLVIVAFRALAVAQSDHSIPPRHYVKRSAADIDNEYDYVVVGGGTSGLVVANRLTEDLKTTVLVVEFGDVDLSWEAAIPYFTNSYFPPTLSYTSIPQIGLNNLSSGLTVGGVVGGGSQVNGMAWDRGSKADYDAWEELGNPGWNWENMLKYFKKSSTFTPPKPHVQEQYDFTWDPSTYGEGPIQVGFASWQWPDARIMRNAWTEDLNVPFLSDHGAGGSNVGLAHIPSNIEANNVTRSTARTGYYDPVSNRTNLVLLVRHYVANVTFDANNTATGVNIISRANGSTTAVRARKEVILAAGAVNSPKILQLSGVGPAKVLSTLGIDVVVDLPGVGANFQDHPSMSMVVAFGNASSLNPTTMSTNRTFYDQSYSEYMANRTGPMTLARAGYMVFLDLQRMTPDYANISASLAQQRAEDFLPDVYSTSPELVKGYIAQRAILARHLTLPDASVFEFPFRGQDGGTFALEKPFSRGTITIRNTNPDPQNSPIIDFGVLRNPVDMQISVLSVKMIRRMFATPSAAVLRPREQTPGAAVQSDAQLEVFVRQRMQASFAHPSGTTSLLPRDLGGVVDPSLKVYGVNSLRVVDAGIMPLIPACHLQSTVYAIAEKAADLIKDDGSSNLG